MTYNDLLRLVESVDSVAYETHMSLDNDQEKQDVIDLYVDIYKRKFKRSPRQSDWATFTTDEILMMIDDLECDAVDCNGTAIGRCGCQRLS